MPADRVAPIMYMDYFGKPGGGTPSEPIPITFPNDLRLPPGTQVELWFYDEAPDGSRPNQWAQYGTGTVSANGAQITPDIDPATGKQYGQPRFCCGSVLVALLRSAFAAIMGQLGGFFTSNGGASGADPVDLATGIFVLERTDLVLPGRLSVEFSRIYRTRGASAGPFGPGTSHNYNASLLIQSDLRTLVLPRGGRIAFPRQPDGTFRNGTNPRFLGAVLTEVSGGHTLRLKDGTTWSFGGPIPFGQPGSGTTIAFLIAQADRNGNTITITRSGTAQNATTITDASGRQLALTYDGANRITVIQDPIGRAVRYAYNAEGHLTTVTDASGAVTRYGYDNQGRMLTLTDARRITFLTNEYDAAGRVVRQIQADGGVWELTYTETNGVITQTTVTDPRGHETTTRFNGETYSLSKTDAQGKIVGVARESGTNLPTTTTDPLGRTTSITYDTVSNVTSITDAEGHVTEFEYESTFNRVTKIIDALDQETTFTYDANGNLTVVADPLNNTTTMSYNAFGQLLSLQGPILTEPPTTFAYDGDGNLIATTDPLGHTTTRAYDAVGRLTRITDPRGITTQFRYDELNRLTEIADARQGLTRFAYDPNGNVLSVTDAKGQATTYIYDSMDRLGSRTDALGREESYQYDEAGNLTEFTDRKNQTSMFTYDALNRRTQAQYANGAATSFVFDSVGRLAIAEESTSGRIEFAYDALDRLVQEITPQGVVEYAYDALGRRATMTVNGLSPVTYQYDAASRLTQVAQDALAVGLGYDAAGRRTSLTYPNGTNTTYAYDNASRLLSIVHDGPAGLIEALTYTYDAAGNRVNLNRANAAASLLPDPVEAAYDAANEQIQFGNPLPAIPNLTYDANGSLETFTGATGTTVYAWDARNRLIAISGPSLSATFAYDALGRRTDATISGVPVAFQYNGSEIITEIRSNSVEARYVKSFELDEQFMRVSETIEFYHADALNSTLALTEIDGVPNTSYQYAPFGTTEVSGTSLNSFQFTGRENNGTGLYYYRARYYRPDLHRFISEDPLRTTTNLYTYVSNRPLVATDPFGLYTVFVRGGSGGAPIGPSNSGQSMQDLRSIVAGGSEPVSDVYGPDAASTALADLLSHQGDPTGVDVVCHSRGCDKIIDQLNQNPDVKVDNLVTLDCYGLSGTCGTIPDNVGQNLNITQDGLLGGGTNRRPSGGVTGITNIQVNFSHVGIPGASPVQQATRICVTTGQCGAPGLGKRK